MTKTVALLAGVIVPLVASMSVATSSYAQSATNDEAYCRALVKEYTHGGIEREAFRRKVSTPALRSRNARMAIRGRRFMCSRRNCSATTSPCRRTTKARVPWPIRLPGAGIAVAGQLEGVRYGAFMSRFHQIM